MDTLFIIVLFLYYKDSGLVVYGAAIYSEGSQFKFPE